MNIITLSKKHFEKLEPLKLPQEIINTEGEILEFNYKRQSKIIKKLYLQSGIIFANKLYTLEMLDTNIKYMPDSFIIPDYLVAASHQIIGFTVPKVEGMNLTSILQKKNYDMHEQLFYLKKVGEILQEMKLIRKYTPLNNFYLNDLHEANFIVNLRNKKIFVIDLDSSKIGSNLACPSRHLTPFSLLNNVSGKYNIVKDTINPGYVIADENSDLYCYNIMILNYIRGSNVNNFKIEKYYNFLNYLDDISISKELLDSFYRLLTNSKNENPYLLLDSISEKQLYKARTKQLD